MHELSIALNIIEIAEETLARHGGNRVRAVHLCVGQLAGIAKDALRFSFGIAAESTAVEGSELLFEDSEGQELQIIRMEIE
jgi:hydrogenase nickel incorporation protein HypA/HybF